MRGRWLLPPDRRLGAAEIRCCPLRLPRADRLVRWRDLLGRSGRPGRHRRSSCS